MTSTMISRRVTLATKNRMVNRKPLSLLLLLMGATLLSSHPATAAVDIISERQEHFKAMGAAMKVMRQQMKSGEMEMAVMLEAAQKLVQHSPGIVDWFPAGSGPESGQDTDALSYIWKNPDKFSRLASELAGASHDLVIEIQKGEPAAVKQQLLKVKNNCSSCHDSFRAD